MDQLSGRVIVDALSTIESGVDGPALFSALDQVVGDDITVPTALAELGSLGLVDGEGLPGPHGANGFVLRGLTPAARALLQAIRRSRPGGSISLA